MQKIPTLFERDWDGDRSRVLSVVHPGCAWVLVGEGVATQKLDGTCCLVRDGRLFKRRELHPGQDAPSTFEPVTQDPETGKTIGWVPVGDGPDDRWHREAFQESLSDGTYELLGPKIQGNPEHATHHRLIAHRDAHVFLGVPRSFEGLGQWLAGRDIEGLVFHHPDGRMAKIKTKDFGHRRQRAFCPLCGSTDGELGTANLYFLCQNCLRNGNAAEQWWTPSHRHPVDEGLTMEDAVRLSPFAKKEIRHAS